MRSLYLKVMSPISARTITREHRDEVVARLHDHCAKHQPIVIISGGAYGPDTFAEEYAGNNNIPCVVYRPDYSKYGRAAPHMRNTEIVLDCTHIIAFWDTKSKGTHNTIKKAKARGKHTTAAVINPTG